MTRREYCDEIVSRLREIEVRLRTQGHTEDGRTLGEASAVIARFVEERDAVLLILDEPTLRWLEEIGRDNE